MYLNKAYIIGNLTRDPELKAIPSGTKVCTFGMATNRYFKDKEGKRQENTEFHNIAVFGRMAELAAQYLKKGSQAMVEGRIQTRSWETDGQKKSRTEIVADNIQFGNRPSGSSTIPGTSSSKDGTNAPDSAGPATGDAIQYPTEEINPDDIPF